MAEPIQKEAVTKVMVTNVPQRITDAVRQMAFDKKCSHASIWREAIAKHMKLPLKAK